MKYNEAIEILKLNNNFDEKELKKAYYKQALKFHPDKTDGKEETFKKVGNAYEYLLKVKNIEKDSNHKNDYLSIIKNLIKLVLPNLQVNDDFLDNNLKNILFKFKNISLKALKKIPREDLINIYTFIHKNQDIFKLDNSLLERILDIIKKEITIDNIIILNPDIDDLLNDNVFCLNFENTELLIPLWHDEVEFDVSKNDIFIKNIPDLSDNIKIDKFNNICINIKTSIKELLDSDLTVKLGKKTFIIRANELKIQKNQIYIFKKQGMLKINKDNLFDTAPRGDIYVNITLF
tara:strand:+ start:8664 stop:9536 length:873 start_codon:yes stop_codon:yes gene_type:complete